MFNLNCDTSLEVHMDLYRRFIIAQFDKLWDELRSGAWYN